MTRWACALAVLLVVPLSGRAVDSLETVQQSADAWVKLRLETAHLATSWQEERLVIESLVVALNEQAATAEERRELVRVRTAKERDELGALQEKIRTEGGELQEFETRLKSLSGKLIALRPSLPPRLSEALEMSYRSIASEALPAGERMQLTMNVLNRCAQFNRSVIVGQDVLNPDGSADRSLQVIYWGLSHGYAVDRAAHQAWLGAPRDGIWRWESQPAAFESIVRLIAIATDKADPDFAFVPATVTRLFPAKAPR